MFTAILCYHFVTLSQKGSIEQVTNNRWDAWCLDLPDLVFIIDTSIRSLCDVELGVDLVEKRLFPVLCYSFIDVLKLFQLVSEFALADVELTVNI